MRNIIKQFNYLPRFPDGRIDYSTSDLAPVVTVFVEYDNKILLLRRSDKVRSYQGLWNTVAGYIDEDKPVEEIVRKEVKEEIGIDEGMIEGVKLGEILKIDDKKIGKKWIVYPALVKLQKRPEIRLDWEHSEYKWIEPDEIGNYQTVYKLEESLKRAIKV